MMNVLLRAPEHRTKAEGQKMEEQKQNEHDEGVYGRRRTGEWM
jgi:hypothetical protein